MRILQVTAGYAPQPGGMETVIQNLAEGLVTRGDEVAILSAAPGVVGSSERMGGVRVVRTSSLGRLLSQPITPLAPVTLWSMARHCDVVHLHMPNPLMEVAVLSLPRRVPVVVTYHNDVFRQRAFRPIYGPIRTKVLERASDIVVPTENNITGSEMLPQFTHKCAIVPHAIAPSRYSLTENSRVLAERLRERYGAFVLFVGRLVYYKGVEHLIESMRDVRGNLVIVGDGPLQERLATTARSLGVAGRVHFMGMQRLPEISAYFAACQALVLPSVTAESFGMVLLEAMLFAKPLVSTRLPSGVSVVNEDEVTGLQVPARDAKALAVALNRLLSDDLLRARMGAAGKARLESRFSLTQMLDGYQGIYVKAVREAAAHG